MQSNQMFQDDLLNSLTNPNWTKNNEEAVKEQAFYDGFQKGLDASQNAVREYFSKNLKHATKITEKMIKEFKVIDFDCESVLLKIHNIDSFELLLIVNKNHFLSESRKSAYKILREIKKKHNNIEFNIDFLIMPNGDSINRDLIKAEGFNLRYEPKSR